MLRIQSTVMLAVLLTASLVFAYSQVTSPNPAYAMESGPNSEVTLREQERQRALAQHYSHPTAESLRPGGSKWERYFEYDADYYATSDFTRIYADKPLQAGEQRKPLQPLSGLIGHGRPHQKHREPIAVQAVPDAPVTFYAPDFGEFSNGSRSITIQADATGRAEVEFTYGAHGELLPGRSPQSGDAAGFLGRVRVFGVVRCGLGTTGSLQERRRFS